MSVCTNRGVSLRTVAGFLSDIRVVITSINTTGFVVYAIDFLNLYRKPTINHILYTPSYRTIPDRRNSRCGVNSGFEVGNGNILFGMPRTSTI
ncbi:hypothetical protein BDW72DRAFT_63014 [Aspergillus terricola var. indicus]